MLKLAAFIYCYLMYSTLTAVSEARAAIKSHKNEAKASKRGWSSEESLTGDFKEAIVEESELSPQQTPKCQPQEPLLLIISDLQKMANYPTNVFDEPSCEALHTPMVMAPSATDEVTEIDKLASLRPFLIGLVEEQSALGRCPTTESVRILTGKTASGTGCVVHLAHKKCNCENRRSASPI